MKLLIFIPYPDGHPLSHFRAILEQNRELGWTIHVVTTELVSNHKGFKALAEEFPNVFTISHMEDARSADGSSELKRLKDQFSKWKVYQQAFNQARREFEPDAVYVISLDEIDLPVGVLGSPFGRYRFAGLLNRRNFYAREVGQKVPAPRPRDRILRPTFHRMLRVPSLLNVLMVEESMSVHAQKAKYSGWQKVRYAPDPADISDVPSQLNLRSSLGVKDDQFLILVYGVIATRKGIDQLINAVADDRCPSNVAILLGGKQDAGMPERLSGGKAAQLRESGRLFEINRFLTSEEERAAFDGADAAWLGYPNWHSSSAIMLQAAGAGTPVLGTDCGVIGWTVERESIGRSFDPDNATQVIGSIKELMAKPEDLADLAERGPILAARHRPSEFAKVVVSVFRELEPSLSGPKV